MVPYVNYISIKTGKTWLQRHSHPHTNGTQHSGQRIFRSEFTPSAKAPGKEKPGTHVGQKGGWCGQPSRHPRRWGEH